MSVTAMMVKELRSRTGAGIMDAKSALVENEGNIEAAIDWLRAKGIAKAAKKSGRAALEGLVGVQISGNSGAIVEVNSETDFVAKNSEFRNFVRSLSRQALGCDSLESLLGSNVDGLAVRELVVQKVASLGENIVVRRMDSLSGDTLASYVHNAVENGMGKIGVLVALEGEDNGIGKQIAMHVAASSPVALSEDDMPAVEIERERQVLLQKARDTGKPEAIIEKIVDGGIRKYLSEETLLGQKFVIDTSLTVSKAAEAAGVKITGFVRFQLGEAA